MTDPLLTIAAALNWGQKQLTHSDSPALDVRVLLCFALEKPDSYLYTWPDRAIEPQQQAVFVDLVARRAQGEPVAHIVCQREFWSLPLMVNSSTLIPRPDTEVLVEQALMLASDHPMLRQAGVLDLGSGTGAIALALASEWPHVRVTGVDVKPEAVELAQCNSNNLKLGNAQFKQGSWFDPVAGQKFALIVSNPPYIDADDHHLTEGDVRFEPLSALVAKEKGLADLAFIATQATEYLLANAWLIMEHGFAQGEAVRNLLTQNGYCDVNTVKDYGGNDRITLGKWNP
ncbi:peptide chain release factor N(5)-glutamine methyltransferase [Motilimonas sp. E26]|uniref:peptide chain release factor N(5)-glutamine methyltransferase n=1 Tax=Motilimonas sp. E26 TaxID=2865674 RepID=UPI001E6136AD|nr:peptide chain release factor N(5)-glutamine methyltransferase [Motilimonas sp. E26]MCE0556054.1 peptide chain release factor N(5)-glutamine methyltransferase [Motilimonas sp. E26]